jgi:hypothetical protein
MGKAGRMLKPNHLIDKITRSGHKAFAKLEEGLKAQNSSFEKDLKISEMRIEGLKKNQAVIVKNPPQTHYDRHYQEVHPCLL